MEQIVFFSDAIDREAIQPRADTHLQNFFPRKDIMLNTTQAFFKNPFELHLAL